MMAWTHGGIRLLLSILDANIMSHIFVSYSRTDKDYVTKLVDSLESNGYDVWYDLAMVTGDEWADHIKARIDNCNAFIVVMTQNSEESVWVKREVLYAMQKKKRIFPLLLQGELWMLLQDKNYANVIGGVLPDEKFFRHLSTIVPRNSDWEIREKARLATEEAERQRIRKEKEEREVAEKLKREIDKRTKDIQRKYKREIFFSRLRNKLSSFFLYFRYYIFPVTLILGVATGGYYFGKPFFDKAISPTQEIEVVQTSTLQPEDTKVVIPSKTIAPTSIQTEIVTPTPLPTEITDAKGVSMVLVPAGTFTMGSNIYDNEKSPHKVTLDDYYLDVYEVTNALYKKCGEENICIGPDNSGSFSRSWFYFWESQYQNYPVIYVDWFQASEFCEWRGARLPTEAEWEKAARGNEGRSYPWGEDINYTFANYGRSTGDTTEVGKYKNGKSPYGMYDMAGNVWEWVSSLYKDYPYDSNDGREDLTTSGLRVIRGGSWNNQNIYLLTFARQAANPVGRDNNLGFRCAKDAP